MGIGRGHLSFLFVMYNIMKVSFFLLFDFQWIFLSTKRAVFLVLLQHTFFFNSKFFFQNKCPTYENEIKLLRFDAGTSGT